jgi:GNAT superfamily N-acetyltransferase
MIVDREQYRIHELSPELLRDYLHFFDNNAFKDNPHWSYCYCYFNHFEHDSKVWKESKASDNRNAVCNLITIGKMNGYLAYYGERVIGWCSAGPRLNMTTLPEYIEPEEDQIGSIVCFLITKEFRKKGVAQLLLHAACNGFKKRGFKYAEGYPLKNVVGDKENHFGPYSLYMSYGFKLYKEDEDTIVVRKLLI